MIEVFEFFLIGFATLRLASLVAVEDGPFDLFAKLRELANVEKQATWVQRGLGCPNCVSFWAAIFSLGLWFYGGAVGQILILWWAVAGLVYAINQVIYR